MNFYYTVLLFQYHDVDSDRALFSFLHVFAVAREPAEIYRN